MGIFRDVVFFLLMANPRGLLHLDGTVGLCQWLATLSLRDPQTCPSLSGSPTPQAAEMGVCEAMSRALVPAWLRGIRVVLTW